jgi:peroxiredoxin
VGKVVPDFGGLDPEGKPLDLKDFRGKAVLVFFWADDMETKSTDIGLMIAGMRPYSPSEVVCIGVNMDGGPDKARSFARKTSLDWPQIVSPLESDSFSDKPVPQLASRFGISAAPYELLFDQEGRLIACGVGFKSVEPALNALIPPKTAASAKTAAAN